MNLSGKRIGPFQLFSSMGAGRTGTVYRAVHMPLVQTVSLKILHPHIAEDTEYVARLHETAQQMRSLRHHNLLPLLDVGSIATPLAPNLLQYVTTPYVDGRTLKAALRNEGPMRMLDALRIIEPIGAALDYLHSQGMVHGSIKPSNMILGQDGRMYLTDAGLSLSTNIIRDSNGGEPAYVALEQAADDKAATQEADLYALADVLYEMLAGRVPWAGTSFEQITRARASVAIPSISQQRPDVSHLADHVFQHALAQQPELRPRNAKSLCLALRRTEMPIAEATTTTPPVPAPEVKPQRSLGRLLRRIFASKSRRKNKRDR